MKYKLKRDLPWASEGTICENTSNDDFGLRNMWIPDYGNIGIEVDTFSDWFEEVDERWKPDVGTLYFVITVSGGVYSPKWGCDSMDCGFFEYGNCFRTKALARMAAEQIKSLLKEFHKNNP